jgi:hypothetical protein
LSYYNIKINNDVAKISNDSKGIIHAHIGVLELAYKINAKHAIRVEVQGLIVEKKTENKDKGNWATGLIEYSISPSWF